MIESHFPNLVTYHYWIMFNKHTLNSHHIVTTQQKVKVPFPVHGICKRKAASKLRRVLQDIARIMVYQKMLTHISQTHKHEVGRAKDYFLIWKVFDVGWLDSNVTIYIYMCRCDVKFIGFCPASPKQSQYIRRVGQLFMGVTNSSKRLAITSENSPPVMTWFPAPSRFILLVARGPWVAPSFEIIWLWPTKTSQRIHQVTTFPNTQRVRFNFSAS